MQLTEHNRQAMCIQWRPREKILLTFVSAIPNFHAMA